MKRFYTKLLLFLVAPIFLITGCKDDDEVNNSDPSIVFSTTRASLANINLDAGTGPNIIGWAVAPAGLKQVSITADKTNGGEEILNVSTFDESNSEKNRTAFEFNVLPTYSPEFTGITVTVIDVNDRSRQLKLEVGATGGLAGPTITGLPEGPIEANVRPTVNIRPEFVGVISSHWGLASITFIEVYGEEEDVVEEVTDFGATPNSYNLNRTPDFDRGYAEGMTGYKIVAVDKKGNTSTYNVVVSVIDAAAAPKITFEEESIEANLTVSPEVRPVISGNVVGFEGLASVIFYAVLPEGDEQLGVELTAFDGNEYAFSITDFPYALGVSGLKVAARDNSGQTTIATIPVFVIAEDPKLVTYSNISIYAQGVRFDQPTAFSFDDGKVYIYDAEPANDIDVAKAIHFIPAAPSGSSASYDIMAPSESWLGNNYYKEITWPHKNATKLRLLDEGEVDFATASSLTINALPLGETVTRARSIQEGSKTVLFETEEGNRGLIYLVGSDVVEGAHKEDKMIFNLKYVID